MLALVFMRRRTSPGALGWLPTALAVVVLTIFGAVPELEAQRSRRRQRRRPPPAEVEAPAGDADAPAVGQTPADPFAATGAGGEASPTGDASPMPEEPSATPTAAFDPGPLPPDVSPIRADYQTLMDDLVQARSRVHALGQQLFRTRVTVSLQDRTAGTQSLSRIVLRLDGAPIFQSDGPVEGAADGREVFTGSVAPGPHVLELEIAQRARADDAYRYEGRSAFRFQVVRERLADITLVLEDSSDIAERFESGGEGRYEVRTRMRVALRALPEGGASVPDAPSPPGAASEVPAAPPEGS